MKIQKQLGPTCLATSVAMILDIPAEVVVDFPNHPHAPHFIEFLPLFLIHNKTFTHVDFNAGVAQRSQTDFTPRAVYKKPPICYLTGRSALLFTESHAVAWDGEKVYDPRGYISDLKRYNVLDVLLVFDLIST